MFQRSTGALLCALSITAGCASRPFPAAPTSSQAISQHKARPASSSNDSSTEFNAGIADVTTASTRSSDQTPPEVVPVVAVDQKSGGMPSAIEPVNEAGAHSAGTMAALVAQENARKQPPVQRTSEGDLAGEAEPSANGAMSTGSVPTPPLAEAGSPAIASRAVVVLNMDNVLQMAETQNPQIAVARERIHEAYARALQADTAWLPSLRAGINYNHHEGTIQDVQGTVFNTNRGALYGGLGANAVGAGSPAVPGLLTQFHFADALFQPAIADHQASARRFGATAVRNDTLRDTAVAYLELVRAEHASRITQEAVENTQSLNHLTRQFAEVGQGLSSDYTRMQAELALRQADMLAQEEAVQVASAQLAQLLHANPGVLITSGEPTIAPLDILSADGDAAGYVADGLLRRPELAEQKHLVCEAVERLRREQYAPLVPSVLLGVSYGAMGGGLGSAITNTGDRWDADAVAYWELRNLGFGEQAARRETASRARQARLRKVAILDQVAREVVEAHARVHMRRARIAVAEDGIAAAEKSYRLNWERIENAQGLPIEVLQSVQALATARRAYLDAVTDYNIAQFQLCHATGLLVR